MKSSTDVFLEGIADSEKTLFPMGFRRQSFRENGPAFFVEYKRADTVVEFLFGPPEWHVEIVIHTANRKLALAELLQIPSISKWYDERSASIKGECDPKCELAFYVDLVSFSLPIIEY